MPNSDDPSKHVGMSSDLLWDLWIVDTFIKRAITRLNKARHILNPAVFKQLSDRYKIAKSCSSQSLTMGKSLFRARETVLLKTRTRDTEIYESWRDARDDANYIGSVIHETLDKLTYSEANLPNIHKQRLEKTLLRCREMLECRAVYLSLELIENGWWWLL